MPRPRPSPNSENSEEARAFLQTRVALFWKVVFFISLLSCGMGAVGAIAKPGIDFLILLVLSVQSGSFWWLCRRGQRSVEFSRAMEAGGLLINLTGGALLGRYLLAGFLTEHSFTTSEGMMMADGYVSILLLGGIALMVAIRAAVIPSAPRRTIVVSALLGIPLVSISWLVVPAADGWLAWRAPNARYPWLTVTAAMMWGFVVITCAIISWVIYGLRVEVQKARRLGQYVLEQKIGEGGMGEVYRARHGMMRRPSALKLLRQERASEIQLHRFEREVQLTARLTHPNTITIFDYGRTHDGIFYYAMELLDGANLQRIVSLDGAQPAGRVVRILSMACGALTEAHEIGLIHRDLKPANIMLCTQGGERDVVKVLDFGLVKELAVDREVKLTGASAIIGTPQYMAPEAILDPDAVDVRTDIYALGAIAYYLLAGVDVFEGKSVVEVCSQHLHQEPKPLSARSATVPAELDAIVLACLSKQPEKRPQSAAELRRRLEACTVAPWDSENARTWWLEHQAEVEADATEFTTTGRTIAVDGSPRSSSEGPRNHAG